MRYRLSAVLVLSVLLAVEPASAKAPVRMPAADDPAINSIALWAWTNDGTHDKVYVIAAYHRFQEPGNAPFQSFRDDILYEVHIARGPTSLADVVTYQFRFTTPPPSRVDPADLSLPPGGGKEILPQLASTGQTYTVVKLANGVATEIARNVPTAPPNIGPRTQAVLNAFGLSSSDTYNDAFAATFIKNLDSGEGRVWAGPRDDGEYRDIGGFHDLLNFRSKGTAQDGLAGFNTQLTHDGQPPGNAPNDANTLGIWTSVSHRETTVLDDDGTNVTRGSWVQVARRGFPLVRELVIGIQDRALYDRSAPADDLANFGAYFLNPVIVRLAQAVGIYAARGLDPAPPEPTVPRFWIS